MGLLSRGTALSWPETKKHSELVRTVGVRQFLALYHRCKDRKGDVLKWGDEIEYQLLTLDDRNQVARVSLMGTEVVKKLQKPQLENPDDHMTKWAPEYGEYVVESTPGSTPYGGSIFLLNEVEENMKLRREQLNEALKGTGTFALTITMFPRIGCLPFTDPPHLPQPATSASRSIFFPDEATCVGHPRFITLTRNVRERRGEKPTINIPVFKDVATPSPFVEDFSYDPCAAKNALPDHVYLDCFGLGMGCACLQVTFQACDIQEARHLYDQLVNVCPIMLALSAGCPILRGYLVDNDCRWDIISGAVDDRTEEERGLKPLKEDKFVIPKSRYDSIDMYLASSEYNDLDVVYDEKVFRELKEGGVDDLLAQHIAHLFVRDSISLFAEKLEQSIEDECDHFDNIQSTNWQSLRFKPPPPNSTIGWRVEFRTMEVLLTDFENAAYVAFVVLLTRAILSFNLNLYIPISKMEENMRRAQVRDAIHRELFYFRKNPFPEEEQEKEGVEADGASAGVSYRTGPQSKSHDDEYSQMTIDAIINGKDDFPGLIPLVRMYVNSIDIDYATRCNILRYLQLISKRASGELPTTATWMRKFVHSHPDYHHDSVVSEKVTYDLIQRMKAISKGGREACPELLGTDT